MKKINLILFIIGFLFYVSELTGQQSDSLTINPIDSSKTKELYKPVEIYENGKPLKFPHSCKFSGKAFFNERPASFLKIWITGKEQNNKHIARKTETNYKGEYFIKLPEGAYQIQVFARQGEVAKIQVKIDCDHPVLPDIIYRK